MYIDPMILIIPYIIFGITWMKEDEKIGKYHVGVNIKIRVLRLIIWLTMPICLFSYFTGVHYIRALAVVMSIFIIETVEYYISRETYRIAQGEKVLMEKWDDFEKDFRKQKCDFQKKAIGWLIYLLVFVLIEVFY